MSSLTFVSKATMTLSYYTHVFICSRGLFSFDIALMGHSECASAGLLNSLNLSGHIFCGMDVLPTFSEARVLMHIIRWPFLHKQTFIKSHFRWWSNIMYAAAGAG